MDKSIENKDNDIANTDALIIEAIEIIRKSKKRPDEHSIVEFLSKNHTDINSDLIKHRIGSLTNNDQIENKGKDGKASYFIMDENLNASHVSLSMATLKKPLVLNNICSTNVAPIKSQLHDRDINERIIDLQKELEAFKMFFQQQFCAMKKHIDNTQQSNCPTNSSNDNHAAYSKSLENQIDYLRDENRSDTTIIQILSENINHNQYTHEQTPFVSPKQSIRNSKKNVYRY